MEQQFRMPALNLLEKDVEAYFKRECAKVGWMSEKFQSPNKRSVPDQLVSKPHNDHFFCELKAPGKKATELQLKDHAKRRKLGHRVYVADSKEAAKQVISIELLI